MRTAFKKAYARIRLPFAYVLLALAIVPQFTPVPTSVGIAAISTLGFILLASIFSIEDRLTSSETVDRFREFYDVATEMRESVLRRALRHGVDIRALGMSMGHAWTFTSGLMDSLASDTNVKHVRVTIAMLDPDWPSLIELNPAWPERTRMHRLSILQYFADHADLVNRRDWQFELRLYRHTPNWHGISLDGEVLFLSTCSWRNGHLVGGENEYERFQRGVGGARTDRAFELFDTWFAHTSNFIVYQAKRKDQASSP